MATRPPRTMLTRKERIETEIEAPPERVWEVLAGFSAYGEWNPYYPEMVGDCRKGAVVEVRVSPTGDEDRTITVRITDFDPERALEWRGVAFFGWLFETGQRIDLEPTDDRHTSVTARRELSGLLTPLVASGRVRENLEAMVGALADRAGDSSRTDA